MLKRFKNLKGKPLLIQVLITGAYPAAKAFTSEQKLLVFCDALTIVAAVLLVAGIVYGLALHGDFDIMGYVLKRGVQSQQKPYDAYRKDLQQKREDAFNYPLFLGLVYMAVSAFIAWVLL